MARKGGPWWSVPEPELGVDEHVVMRWLANRSQGWRAVGGLLFLTDTRLIFHPQRLDQLTGGRSCVLPLAEVVAVDVAPATGRLTDGGLRDRLGVQMRTGETELFVVNGLSHVVEAVRSQLAA